MLNLNGLDIAIGKLEVKFLSGKAVLLYKIALKIFESLITSKIQEAITSIVCDVIEKNKDILLVKF